MEYLAEGASSDCPLIRLFSPSAAEFAVLHAAVDQVASGELPTKELHELPGMEPINIGALTISVGTDAEGLEERSPGKFVWSLRRGKWRDVAEFIEPFMNRPSRPHAHQWLCGKQAAFGLDVSSISVLISNSPSGQW